MQDYIVRALAARGELRAMAAVTTRLVEHARQAHATYPTATAALGRVLTAAALLGVTLKDQETVTLRWLGNGPLGALVAVGSALGSVKGYVTNPQVDLPARAPGKLDVGGAVGSEGMLYVVKDLRLKEPYRGSVPLVSGEIAEDLTRYLWDSEQTPGAVSLGVLVGAGGEVRAAGGFIIQLMPGTDNHALEQLEQNLANQQPVSSLLDAGYTPEQVLEQVMQGLDIQFLGRQEVQFNCDCSRDRMLRALLTLGRQELEQILQEEGQAELVCHFCNQHYCLDRGDLQQLLAELE